MSVSLLALPQAIDQTALLEASLKQAQPDATLQGPAGCLVPLLTALKWRGDPNQLIESLPHFVGELDVDDLRDVLARLGFPTHAVELRARDVDARTMPCLYESDQGRVIALLARDGEQFRIFDPDGEGECVETLDGLRGRAFVADTRSASDNRQEDQETPWFSQVIGRFRRTIAIMFAVTFVVNMLAVAVPLSIMVIYDQIIGRQNGDFLPYLAVGVALAMTAEFLLRLVRSRGQAYLSSRLEFLIGSKAMAHITHLPYSVVERAPVGKQLARIKEFESLRDFFTGPLVTIAFDLPFVIVFLIVIALVAGPVALVPLGLIALYALMGLLVFPAMRRRVKAASIERSERQSFIVETLTEMRSIKVMGAENLWYERFRDVSSGATLRTFQANYLNSLVQTLSHVLMVLGGVGVLALSVLQIEAGAMTMGALIATMALTWRVLAPIQSGFNLISRLEQVLLSIRQLNELLRFRLERTPDQFVGERKLFTGKLEFHRVSLRYLPGHAPALMGVSFAVRPGEMVALTGSSGSGKSSLLRVALRLYEPQAGSITLDGIDTRQLDPAELRRALAYVSQETQVLYGTIAQNLRFGNFSASLQELRDACRLAGMLDEIDALPEGFETRIGDNLSSSLPAGFHQRLALARAYLSSAPVLLLDEAANALDDAGDAKFRDALEAMRGSRTILFATHRPSHMRLADRVVVLSDGVVAADGPPDEVVPKLLRQAI